MTVSTIDNETCDDKWVEIQGLGYDLSYYVKAMSDECNEWDEVVGIKMNEEDVFKSDLKLNLCVEDLYLEPYTKPSTMNLIYEDMSEAIKDFEDNFEKNFEEMKEKLRWYEKYNEIRKNRKDSLKRSISSIESEENSESCKKMKKSEE